jgi:hypothetical protein
VEKVDRDLDGLLGGLARKAPPLTRTDTGAWTARDEGHCRLLDQAQILSNNAALRAGVLYNHRSLQYSANTDGFTVDDCVEASGDFVIERRHDAGKRNQFCDPSHSSPPKAGAATKKSRPRLGPFPWVGEKRCYQKPETKKAPVQHRRRLNSISAENSGCS